MDGPPSTPRPLSRLPLPSTRLSLRQSPSRDSLAAAGLISPRLRSTPSRDQLPPTRSVNAVPNGRATSTPAKGVPKSENGLKKAIASPPVRRQEPASRPSGNTTPRKPDQSTPPRVAIEDEQKLRKPRQSLSERTMETLSQLPPSPATRRRESSFFNPESPMRPPSVASNSSRPGSSHQADMSMPPPLRTTSSRPGSSTGYRGQAVPLDFRASTNTFPPRKSSFIAEGPAKQPPATKQLKMPTKVRSNASLRSSSTPSKLPPPGMRTLVVDKTPIPVKKIPKMTPIKSGSQTVAARPLRPRASVGGLFRKPSMPDLGSTGDRSVPVKKNISPISSNSSSEGTSTTSKGSPRTTSSIDSIIDQNVTPRKSSLALREQIAKAKAAKRASTARKVSGISVAEGAEESSVIPAGTFDFGLSEDPFNQQRGLDGSKGLLRKRIDSARTEGRLNIAAMGLKEIPSEVMNMYNFDPTDGNGSSWAESVDLTRFVVADNELEVLAEDVFPDIDPAELSHDDDSKGNQFGGLETLDLHGNLLKSVPLGLRRLQLLTTLNLSNNRLDNDTFEVISQITSLRDLKIGKNNLSGQLSDGITNLHSLEVLDIHNNNISTLPDGLVELVRLRVLNLSQNCFTSLPFERLHHLPLIELSAAKNKLDGVLVELADVELPKLQILDITANSLTSLALGQVKLPSLHRLSCSSNRLTSLPEMTTWKDLITIAAEDNHISEIPEGFVTLPKIRNVDLTGNNLKALDDRIGQMESLDILRISGNPLRERKFSSMTVEELKRALSARLAPPEIEIAPEESSEVFTSCPSSPTRPNATDWPIKAGGILDRSNTQSTILDPLFAAQTAENSIVKVLDFRHNLLKEIPSTASLFSKTLTTLILANNDLTAETFMTTTLHLPALKDLNIACNNLTTLQPLLTYLSSPQLATLNISFNRLPSLPILRSSFPDLTVVLASNNSICELPPEAVTGLRVLDASSNDIASLNPGLGLLGLEGEGLERLELAGNRFRVPSYRVLERGTEATLKWLRDRIPAEELGAEETVAAGQAEGDASKKGGEEDGYGID